MLSILPFSTFSGITPSYSSFSKIFTVTKCDAITIIFPMRPFSLLCGGFSIFEKCLVAVQFCLPLTFPISIIIISIKKIAFLKLNYFRRFLSNFWCVIYQHKTSFVKLETHQSDIANSTAQYTKSRRARCGKRVQLTATSSGKC